MMVAKTSAAGRATLTSCAAWALSLPCPLVGHRDGASIGRRRRRSATSTLKDLHARLAVAVAIVVAVAVIVSTTSAAPPGPRIGEVLLQGLDEGQHLDERVDAGRDARLDVAQEPTGSPPVCVPCRVRHDRRRCSQRHDHVCQAVRLGQQRESNVDEPAGGAACLVHGEAGRACQAQYDCSHNCYGLQNGSMDKC